MRKPNAILIGAGLAISCGAALAQVAGTVKLGVTVEEQRLIATGWSARNQILGQSVYNDAGKTIGTVKDIIIGPDEAVSYAIIGTGGFLGLGQHDVLIPAGRLRVENDMLILPGANEQELAALPEFEYVRR